MSNVFNLETKQSIPVAETNVIQIPTDLNDGHLHRVHTTSAEIRRLAAEPDDSNVVVLHKNHDDLVKQERENATLPIEMFTMAKGEKLTASYARIAAKTAVLGAFALYVFRGKHRT